MPFSLLIEGFPTSYVPSAHIQGPVLQGMFLHLIEEVDPAVCRRLHDDSQYRPYTLSPLGIVSKPSKKPNSRLPFQGFQWPRDRVLHPETPCMLRVTLLEDDLFPTFSRYFLSRAAPTFRLGETTFRVTNVAVTADGGNPWSRYTPYTDLIEQASRARQERAITLRFLSPTSFRRGNVDFPMPDPRLVFRSYRARFEEFAQIAFLPDFDEQVEFYTGVARLQRLETTTIRTKKVALVGFMGSVTYTIDRKAPPDLLFQMNLLADFAFFCGTGRKTTVGMGQTVRMKNAE